VILLLALALGLLIGVISARLQRRPYRAPSIQAVWLALIAFALQWVVAYFPRGRHLFPDWFGSLALLVSLLLLLLFAWWNRSLAGMGLLLGGLVLNLIVIAANGGWMPIRPETAAYLVGSSAASPLKAGQRFGPKDIILPAEETRLEFLADRFLVPRWFPWRVAFSLGDVLIALGVFWLLARPTVHETPRPKRMVL